MKIIKKLRWFIVFLMIVSLSAGALYIGSTLSQDKVYYNFVLNGQYINTPSNWRSFAFDEGKVHYQQAVDEDEVVRFAIATVSYDAIPRFSLFSKENYRVFCDSVVAQSYTESIDSDVKETDVLFRYIAKFIHEDQNTVITIISPKDSNYLYEILEVQPTPATEEAKSQLIALIPK